MSRLTTNKKASEMGMYELAHNCCYVGEDGSARYRDFSSDVDCRKMIKMLMANFCNVDELEYLNEVSDEEFDDEMMENLIYGTNNLQGLMAVFYRNMWAMADLREKLKYFEDLEEQGLLLKLPCKLRDETYWIDDEDEDGNKGLCVKGKSYVEAIGVDKDGFLISTGDGSWDRPNKSRWCFLTKEEAEKALERLECAE